MNCDNALHFPQGLSRLGMSAELIPTSVAGVTDDDEDVDRNGGSTSNNSSNGSGSNGNGSRQVDVVWRLSWLY